MTIHFEELDEETRKTIGIGTPQPSLNSEIVAPDIVALGSVLKALKGLSVQKAVEVLENARKHLTGGGFYRPESVEEIPVTMDIVIDAVSQVMDVSREDILGKSRKEKIAEARQIVMYFLRMNDRNTLSLIGEKLGYRTPATITHGFQNIARKMVLHKTLKARIDEIDLVIKRKVIVLEK